MSNIRTGSRLKLCSRIPKQKSSLHLALTITEYVNKSLLSLVYSKIKKKVHLQGILEIFS